MPIRSLSILHQPVLEEKMCAGYSCGRQRSIHHRDTSLCVHLRETEGSNFPQAENGIFLGFCDVRLCCPRSTTVPSCLQTVLIHTLFLHDVESKPSICKVKRVLCSSDNTSRIKEKRRGLRPQRFHGEVVEPSKRSRRNSQMKLPLSLRSESPQKRKRSA